MNKSWKTTLAGLGALLAVLGPAINAQFDGKPETVPQWDLVLSAAFACAVGLFARDNDKSSEQVGAKEPSNPTKAPLAVLAVLCALTFSGCTTVTQSASTVDPDGTHRDTKIQVSTMGDAKQVVAELRASNGKTQSLGSKGIEQEASLENVVKLLQMIFDAGKSAGTAAATGGVVR